MNSIFGWIVSGELVGNSDSDSVHFTRGMELALAQDHRMMLEMERFPDELNQTSDELKVVKHFDANHTRLEEGRYIVSLCRKEPTPKLGDSRSMAERRLHHSRRSLSNKGKWPAFQSAIQEYEEMNHAELVPEAELQKPHEEVYYLPMHGVEKATSQTTKLCVVWDASAKSRTGISLNDQLLPGHSLFTNIHSTINKFRMNPVGVSSDVSKMFREVELHPSERDFHRFLAFNEHDVITSYRMKRLTFGMTPSSFLAAKVLKQIAIDHKEEYPEASEVVQNCFYVDDLLTGTTTAAEAITLAHKTTSLLSKGHMTLRKWRSSSSDVLEAIPEHLRTSETSTLSLAPESCDKALGIHWNTVSDSLHVSTPTEELLNHPTKRQLSSVAAKTFDIMGWYSPSTVLPRFFLRETWINQTPWDSLVNESLLPAWDAWKKDLHILTDHPIPRYVSQGKSPPITTQLHGFSDASDKAYGGVIYLRPLHQDGSISVSLLSSKTKLAPIKPIMTPRMELNGARVLARLLASTSKDLNIPKKRVFAYTDSSIVLGWLRRPPNSLVTYVANRVTSITDIIPSSYWRHIPTDENPADLLSRGVLPGDLLSSELWWSGPSWLAKPVDQWTVREDLNVASILPDLRQTVLTIQDSTPAEFWKRFSRHNTIGWS